MFLVQLYGRELSDHDPAHSPIAEQRKIFSPYYILENSSSNVNTIDKGVACYLAYRIGNRKADPNKHTD